MWACGPAYGIVLSSLLPSFSAKVFSSLINNGLQSEGHILNILPLNQFLPLQLLLKESQCTPTHIACTKNNRCPGPGPSKT